MKLLPGMFDNGVFPEGEQRWIRILVKNTKKCCKLFQLSNDNPNYKVTSITFTEDYNPTLNSLRRIEDRVSDYLGEIGVPKSDIQGVKILFQKEVLEFLKDTQKDLKSLELEAKEPENKIQTYSKEEVLEFLNLYCKDYGGWTTESTLSLFRNYKESYKIPEDHKFTEPDFYNILKQISAYNVKMVSKFLTWSIDREMMKSINAGA